MKGRLQFGAWVCGLVVSVALLAPCVSAQGRPSQERPPARQQAPPPRPMNRPAGNDRSSGSYHPQNAPHPQNSQRGGNANRQPGYQDRGGTNDNRQRGNPNDTRQNGNQNSRARERENGTGNRNDRPQSSSRQQTLAVPPPNVQERLRNMSPQEQRRLADNQRKFNQLPPQKQQEMKRAAENWQRLTPEQQNHLRNDVLPKWQQLPADRQRAIQNRLGVLQNMPESARNRHLNDPSFTRGMNDEDRQMLRDLSHEHVGAPDQPQEQ